MTLTEDQRWLLRMVGLSLSRALISDSGLDHLMGSMLGHRGSPHEGAPEWMHSFDVQGGRIYSPDLSAPKVVVTAAKIRKFRKTIPAELLDELTSIDKAQMDEHWRTELWCRCGSDKPHMDFLRRERYHPSDDEDEAHLEVVWELRNRERGCLHQILGFTTEPVGQLELFEVA